MSTWSTRLGLALSAVALSTAGVAFAAEKELVIGQNDALSGGGAVYGIPQQRAVQLAVEEINAKGGIDGRKVEVVVDMSAEGFALVSSDKLHDGDTVLITGTP